MKPSLQKLIKFLKLEAERGYDNRAVMGGLEKMLIPWEAEARVDELPEELIRAVNARLRDYHQLTQNSRAEALEGLWGRLQREMDTHLPTLPPVLTQKSEISETKPQQPEQVSAPASEEGKPTVIKPETSTAQEELKEIHKTETVAVKAEITETTELPLQKTAPPKISRPPAEGASAALSAPITVLSGVGPRHGQTLSRLGLKTLGDMLYYYPRRYDDYTQLKPINRLFYGEEVTVIATIQSVSTRPIRGGRAEIEEAVVNDGSGALRITWFNQPWQAKRLRNGMQIVLSGKIDQYLGRLVMNNPEWEPLEQQNLHTNRIVPVYPLTANITQRWLRRLMYQVVNYWAARVQDHLPEEIRRKGELIPLSSALLQVHFPDSLERLKSARQRLAFDEIFLLQLGVLRQKRTWQNRSARIFDTPEDWLAGQVERLPFDLTGAQQNALSDVKADLLLGRPMNRLLQGDVGSGKTVIAAMAIAILAYQGAQSAVLAPTSILAEQHYQNLLKLLSGDSERAPSIPPVVKPEQIRLIIGATPESEKQILRLGLANGEIKVIIGTHALLEDPVIFADLQLAVIDEQHRFGVNQRSILRSKGSNPHLLVMTATPIPRSLALTIYGDLDLSVMDEMPPGRQKIDTYVLFPRERERAYTLIRSQVESGSQAFIIYPLIEESDNSEALAAVEEHQRLQREVFPKQKLGLLHGRIKPDEKDTIMTLFRDKQIDILVSTSVVEVGVDIPNASVMLIEGANRFGLAQLHQFRGRVGRGGQKAYCILIPDSPDAVENERLSVMSQTNDGFKLAERDLEQRGPGEFLGTRQAGYSELRLANITDIHMIEKARELSQYLFEIDPDLVKPEQRLLASTLQHFWGDDSSQAGKGDIS